MSPSKTVTIIKTTQKCRCCTNPSSKFLELDSASKSCGTDKTYKDVLYEIINIKVSSYQEKSLTQKVCQKCSTQLNNCYKFIIQAREVYEQYLSTLDDSPAKNDIKHFEYIPEPLIEVPIDLATVEKSPVITKESPIAATARYVAPDEIKTEPLSLECWPNTEDLMNVEILDVNEIKAEKPELVEDNFTQNPDKKYLSTDLTYEQHHKLLINDSTNEEESREHFDNFNTNSDDDDNITQNPDKKYLSTDLTYEHHHKVLINDLTNEEESREHFDNFNINSDDDDEDAEDPIFEDDFDKDLSEAPIAISCDICHKIYKDKVALRTHKHYTHMPDEKKRPCPLCSFKSSRLSNLKVHIGVVHGAEKVKEIFKPTDDNGVQFPCSICQQSFRRKDTLQKHIKRIHQNPLRKESRPQPKIPKEKERFLCTYCGGSFCTKYGLSRHVVIHTGERPFPCEICQKTFKRPEDLHIHRIIHSDEKPHQCLQCGKAFKRSDKLKIHMRVHSELRPYKCNECEKTFKYPNVLTTHMLIHTGKSPFQCKTCGESFSLRSSFNTHCLRNGHL